MNEVRTSDPEARHVKYGSFRGIGLIGWSQRTNGLMDNSQDDGAKSFAVVIRICLILSRLETRAEYLHGETRKLFLSNPRTSTS